MNNYLQDIYLFTSKGVEFQLGVIAGLVSTGILYLLNVLRKFIKNRSKKRKFFGEKTQHFTLFTGQIYFKPSNHRYMASGDIKSTLTLALNIHGIFKLTKLPHRFSNEAVFNEDFRENVISIGGPKHNLVTKAIIEKYISDIPNFPAKFIDNRLIINAIDSKQNTFKKEFCFNRVNGQLTCDYGLLIRGINPFDDSRSSVVWVISGSGSNGCLAAVDQMSTFIHGSASRFKRMYKYLRSGLVSIVVVKANFVDGEYVSSVPVFFASYKPISKILPIKKYCWTFREINTT